jgi:hypothetical protein
VASAVKQNGHPGDHFTSLTQESLTSHPLRPFGAHGGPLSSHFQGTQLTQESLNSNKPVNGLQNGHLSGAAAPAKSYANNTSYDDLPPPPPPLSSSPTEDPRTDDSDSAQDSSLSMPVPQQRNQPRRNQYVNMPVPPLPHQPPADDWPGKSRNGPDSGPPAHQSHNYANMARVSYTPEPSIDPPSRHRGHGQMFSGSRYAESSADESQSLSHQVPIRTKSFFVAILLTPHV